MGVFKFLVFVAIPLAVAYYVYWFMDSSTNEVPTMRDGWWGKESSPPKTDAVDKPPVSFTVKASNATLVDLRNRLENTRFPTSLEGTAFEYGFHSDYLRSVVLYWKDSFNWEAQQAKLNAFAQFKVKIEGIDIHFVRAEPKKPGKKRAIMFIHGWAGSYWEYFKVLHLLTESEVKTTEESLAFEIICPSIPGFGFSEAPHKPGFDAADAARIFAKLMKKLGHEKFYVQGGDWGSVVATIMAQAYPDNILGVHVNFAAYPLRSVGTLGVVVRHLIGEMFPSLIYTPAEISIHSPISETFFFMLKESGYLHLQSTKPDSIAAGLTDSPAGLAAYILEKISVCSNRKNTLCADGCITKHFTLDEVLTNIMIYWLSGSIGSSMRFYKENFASNEIQLRQWDRVPVIVPSGMSVFPHEVVPDARSIAEIRFRNIVSYTVHSHGGHFAAFEVPELFAEDIKEFVKAVESLKSS